MFLLFSHPWHQQQTKEYQGGRNIKPSTIPTSTDPRTSTNARSQGNVPYPLGLTNHDHVVRYACLNKRMIVATYYYDDELLGHLGMLDDI